MKKNILVLCALFGTCLARPAQPTLSDSQLAEQLAYANAAYKRYDSGQSLGSRIKARLPFAHTLLSKEGNTRTLINLRHDRNALEREMWRRQGKKQFEIWVRQHYPEILMALAGLGVVGGAGYAVGKPIGSWKRARDNKNKAPALRKKKPLEREKNLIKKKKEERRDAALHCLLGGTFLDDLRDQPQPEEKLERGWLKHRIKEMRDSEKFMSQEIAAIRNVKGDRDFSVITKSAKLRAMVTDRENMEQKLRDLQKAFIQKDREVARKMPYMNPMHAGR